MKFGICILVLILFASPSRAQPADSLAFIHVDSARLGAATNPQAQRAVIDSLWAWFNPGRVIQHAGTESLIQGVVTECLVQGVPLSVCVLSAAEEPGQPDRPVPAKLRPVRFQTVLSIRPGEKKEAIAKRVETLVKEVNTPGPPNPNAIEWIELPDQICVGIGDGALARWTAPPGAREATDPLALHRAEASPGEAIVELFVGIDQLRRAFPDRFDDDAGARLLDALHLANARSFMVHVRAPGELPASFTIDATWSVRSEPRTSVRRITVAAPIRGVPAPPGPQVDHAMLAPEWSSWVVGGLDAYAAILNERDALDFARSRRTWGSRRLPVLARLNAVTAPGVVVSLDRDESGCSFGALVVRFPIRQGTNPEQVERDVRSLFDPFAPLISTDAREHTWWLKAQPKSASPIRALSWGMVRDDLVLTIDLGVQGEWSWKALSRLRGGPR